MAAGYCIPCHAVQHGIDQNGALGCDSIQTINTRSASKCGKIHCESKRTKAIQSRWI
jgi:hypothetical protein